MTEEAERAVTDAELLSLQQAADLLKVHYMTAYRWVRKGLLPAFKAGGRLRVRLDDIERFVAEREVDIALPSTSDRRTEWPRHVTRFTKLLLDGDGVRAGALVRKVVADGAPAGDVYVRLIAPALHRVGEAWEAGRITVADEHRSTEICSALMASLAGFFRRRGISKGTAVTFTPAGELHGLGARMAADFLRAAGYEVHHLGADLPADDLALFLKVVPADVVCVSVTNPTPGRGVYTALVEATHRSREHAVVVFGGQGADRARVEAAGGRYLEQLDSLTESLHPVAVGG